MCDEPMARTNLGSPNTSVLSSSRRYSISNLSAETGVLSRVHATTSDSSERRRTEADDITTIQPRTVEREGAEGGGDEEVVRCVRVCVCCVVCCSLVVSVRGGKRRRRGAEQSREQREPTQTSERRSTSLHCTPPLPFPSTSHSAQLSCNSAHSTHIDTHTRRHSCQHIFRPSLLIALHLVSSSLDLELILRWRPLLFPLKHRWTSIKHRQTTPRWM